MSRFDDLKTFTEALRDLLAIFLYAAAAILFLLYVLPFIKTELKNKTASIDQIDIAGVTLSLSDKLNTPARTETKDASDMKVDMASKLAAVQLDSTIGKDVKSYWVYLGHFDSKHNRPASKAFNLESAPAVGATITAARDVYKRDNAPDSVTQDNWKSGNIIGILRNKTSVQVLQVDEMNNNYWAEVK